jgi:hypothetical protein
MTEKTFNPDYNYTFWFRKSKLDWILNMLGLIIDYAFEKDEINGIMLSLANTNDQDGSKWSGGLHYGNKGTMYITMALDNEDKDIIHMTISTAKKFQSNIEFADLLQCTYEGFHQYRSYH